MSQSRPENRETDVPETIQSLLVAFTIALAFRGFVVEGFVIPTGSMAPTLMGQHVRYQAPDTGYEYAFDGTPLASPELVLDPKFKNVTVPTLDPMISRDEATGTAIARELVQIRQSRGGGIGWGSAGDRVLVLKYLYEFFEPDRWDVVVFKNPVDPIGPSQNYIKRLVGLPNEQVLIADGDIFTAPLDAELEAFRVARRPAFVQEAIWQPVYDSDFIPLPADSGGSTIGRRPRIDGPPFKAGGPGWDLADTRRWRFDAARETRLHWADDQLSLNDFNAYNVYRYLNLRSGRFTFRNLDAVSDLRVSAAIMPEDAGTFATALELDARGHRFEFELSSGKATITMRDGAGATVDAAEGGFEPGPAGLIDAVFTHVDQALVIEVGGREVVRLEYEWNPLERLEASYLDFDLDQYRSGPQTLETRKPRLSWRFQGSPFEMTRVRVERDLHYKTGLLDLGQQVPANGPRISGLLHATDPIAPSVLGPDHFLMLGDNSGASRDSRYWGRPHPLSVSVTGDDAPFLVPRDMLVGKAWCVYFPAPTSIAGSGPRYMPDFGRLRFIR